MSTAVKVRDLAESGTVREVDIADMPSGELTVQHILDRAGVGIDKAAVLVGGKKVTDMTSAISAGAEIIVIPNVSNG